MQAVSQSKNRITLLFSLLTGCILLAACLLAALLSVRQQNESFTQVFDSRAHSVFSMVEDKDAIDVVTLYQYAKANGLVLALYENGRPLAPTIPVQQVFHGDVITIAENALADSIWTNGTENNVSIKVPPEGSWRAAYRTVKVSGSSIGLMVLQAEAGLHRSYAQTATFWGIIFLCALAGLIAVSRFLASIAAKPMQQAYRQQLEFTTAAGHDLRTPLAVIKSSSQLISEKIEVAHNAQIITAEANRLSRLVDDLLLLSAGRAEILPVYLEAVDVEDVLISCYDSFSALAKEKGFLLTLTLPDRLLAKAEGDKARIAQILGCFISNALSYSTPGTCIDISACEQKKHIVIQVADQGGGIPDEHKGQIFHQFYRLNQSRSDKEHFGLGLSVAQKLAQAQKAGIQLCDTPGGGATFKLKLNRYRQ